MTVFINAMVVGLGGFLGAILRYLSGLVLNTYFASFPVATLFVNGLGSFFIGLISGLAAKSLGFSDVLLLFLTLGLLGGFTTFSSFSLDTVKLLEQGKLGLAGLNIFASFAICLLACGLGRWLSAH